MALRLMLNGLERTLETLEDGANLGEVVVALALKSDRVAVEHNGEIAPRRTWGSVAVRSGDKLEVVHFVGGGSGKRYKGLPNDACCTSEQKAGG